MDIGEFYGGGTIDNYQAGKSIQSLTYGPNWLFDDSTEITVCSDLNQASPIECTISNLKVGYSVNSWSSLTDLNTKGFSLLL